MSLVAAMVSGMTETTIREATADDVPGLVECSIALFAEDGGTRDPGSMNVDWPKVHAADSLREGIGDPDRLVLAAVRGGRVVGSLSGSYAGPTEMRLVSLATLKSMYVRPEARGDGVGSQLVEAFKAWARGRKAQRIGVTAYASNEGAIRFYRRHGFAPLHLELQGDLTG